MNGKPSDTTITKRGLTFIPSISFDGIAIITSVILCSVWFGTLSATVHNHTDQLKHQQEVLEIMSKTQETMSQNIAVLTTLVNERTKR